MESEVPEVARELAALYGEQPLAPAGVVHVSACVRAADGALRVLKIGPDAPKSATDFFILNLCRARADAILTTAANLRAEPTLVHTLSGPWAAELARYRGSVLGKLVPPVTVIMTRSGELPRAHPVWADGTGKLVLTAESAAQGLAEELGAQAEVVGLARLDARSACAYLARRGLPLISVEAGPSTSGALYAAPSPVDELLLSLCEAQLTAAAIGGALPEERVLFAARRLVSDVARDEASGPWRFQRWVRDAQR